MLADYDSYVSRAVDSGINVVRYDKEHFAELVPYPSDTDNKYSRGMCVLAAGSELYPGAALMSTIAALRSGIGYVKLYTEPVYVKDAAFALLEAPVEPLTNLVQQNIGCATDGKPMSYVIGPGFIPDASYGFAAASNIMSYSNAPVLIDGGALSLFSNPEFATFVAARAANGFQTVLTPHLGEAKALAVAYGLVSDVFAADNVPEMRLARELSLATSCVVVLKGPVTFIDDGVKCYPMTFGTSALAKAGTGDVLAGLIGGLMSQGKLSAFDACCLGTVIHAGAGRLAEDEMGGVSVCAQDVLDLIPDAFINLE